MISDDLFTVIILCIMFLFLILFVIYKIYEYLYFKSSEFLRLKQRIFQYVYECNDMNNYIERLKICPTAYNYHTYANSNFHDNSIYKYKRPDYRNHMYGANVYNCSRNVCDNARANPFKYICKYFNIIVCEDTLQEWQDTLNNFEAAEMGKNALIGKRNTLFNSIKSEIPFLITAFCKKQKIESNLGFIDVNMSNLHFPKYVFNYVSSGGYASTRCEIVLDIPNINNFIFYLNAELNKMRHAKTQRTLMTSSLRQSILQRDNYTCRQCGISTYHEPHLLLEVDHIMPISKGGFTEWSNLQTLCWKCNRTKGNKIYH